jgi:putative FmdB family regulatory protein
MPLYEYKCDCGLRFEELLPMGSVTPACPKCGSLEATRVMSRFGVGQRNGAEDMSGTGLVFKDCREVDIKGGRIAGFKKGIEMERTSASISKMRFRKNRTSIATKDSDLRLDDPDFG